MMTVRPNKPIFSVENSLFLLCLRRTQDEATQGMIRECCAGNLDWDYVLQESNRQCVGCLLFRALSAACPDRVPLEIMSIFKTQYDHNIAHNLKLTAELVRLITAFNERGIEAILYKGPIQASEIYGNLALRQICDLDFIIHRDDQERVFDLLLKKGYQPWGGVRKEDLQARLNDRSVYDLAYVHQETKIGVEIHWQVLRSHSELGVNGDFLWRQAKPTRVGGVNTLRFSPEVRFLLMCLHNEKHQWQYIKFLCDIAWILERQESIDLDKVISVSSDVGRENIILKDLFLAHTLFDVPLSAEFLARLNAMPQIKMECSLIHFQLLRVGFALPFYSEWLDVIRSPRYLGRLPDKLSGRLRYFFNYLRVILTPQCEDRKIRANPLPSQLNFVYVIARVLRFAKYWTYNHHLNKRNGTLH